MTTFGLLNRQVQGGWGWFRPSTGRRARGRRAGFGAAKRALWVLATPVRILAVPLLVVLACGYWRGESFDQMMADFFARGADSLLIWMSSHWVHPAIAWALVRCLQFGTVGLVLLGLALLVTRIRNFVPCVVISEIARRQGRRASGADLLMVVSLPIALAVSLARTDALALWAAGWFCISHLYCLAAYHPSKLRSFVDWIVKIRSPFDVPAGENGGDNHFAV